MSPEHDIELHQLRLAEEVARQGCYSLNQVTGAYIWTQGMYALLELDPATPATFDTYSKLVPPEDLTAWTIAARMRLDGDTGYTREYRLWVGAQRHEIWVRARSRVFDIDGEPHMLGVLMDITEQMSSREEIAVLNRQLLATVASQQHTIDLLAAAQALLGQQPGNPEHAPS